VHCSQLSSPVCFYLPRKIKPFSSIFTDLQYSRVDNDREVDFELRSDGTMAIELNDQERVFGPEQLRDLT
jgi:hypothetical protein